jgi:hypothetical protein
MNEQNRYKGVILNFNVNTTYNKGLSSGPDGHNIHMTFRPDDPELRGFLVPIVYSTTIEGQYYCLLNALRKYSGVLEDRSREGNEIPAEVVLDEPIRQEKSAYSVVGLVKLLVE